MGLWLSLEINQGGTSKGTVCVHMCGSQLPQGEHSTPSQGKQDLSPRWTLVMPAWIDLVLNPLCICTVSWRPALRVGTSI